MHIVGVFNWFSSVSRLQVINKKKTIFLKKHKYLHFAKNIVFWT